MTRDIHVLHVESDSQFTELTAAYLQQEIETIALSTETRATDALTSLRQADTDVDCIVSAYDFPGMNGVEFLRAVREDYPRLPFILFTGKGSESVASEALAADATDYLQKQKGTEQYHLLANRIRNAVQQYRESKDRQKAEHYRQRLYEIASDTELRFDRKTKRLLELGCERLGVENGHVTRIDRHTNRHEIRIAAGSDFVQPGTTSDLSETYCQRTISEDTILTVYDAVERGWENEPAYERWGIGCYIGGKIEVGGDLYGTVCFVDQHPKSGPFTERERTFVDLLTRWLSHLVEQRQRNHEAERYRRLFENLPVGVFRTTLDGEIVRANGTVLDVYNAESDEQLRQAGAQVLYVDASDRERLLEEIRKTGQIKSKVLEVETPDGEKRAVRTSLTLVEEDGTQYLEGVVQDVTRRRELERECERIKAIAESLNDPAYVVDENGRFTYVNDEFVRLVGYPEDEIIGSTPALIKDEDAVDETERQLGQLLSSDGPDTVTFEVMIRPQDGDPVLCEDRMEVLPDEGDTFNGSVGMLRDISERKRRERALRRERDGLDEFASVVSHDLRNPLNVATGRLRIVQDECDSRHLDDIEDALGRMDELIDDLSTLARDGQQVADTEPVALAEISNDCWANVESPGASLRVETDRTIRCDLNRLGQLFENLYRNAIEHGGSDVTVTVGELDEGFYIEDDGSGVPDGKRDQVLDSGFSTATTGTGFGLGTVQQVVESHGWRIDLTEGKEGGARFEITGVEFVN
ncbi:PAS domain S-box protein [Halobellus ruber]|uniref:histidine kinase n=1 Tax=Halobellus ruber TaxID=2761102 RepID=A0A7J9SEK1_9EURY|nr:PAS domain S-box protein [Halobellus ruber]MBB6645384.1 PAS domain S-box protein [Halobellus ruber]